MSVTPALRIEPLGDDAVLLHLGDCINVALNARVHDLAAWLRAVRLPGLIDLVPAYASLLLRFDPLTWDQNALQARLSAAAEIARSTETSCNTIWNSDRTVEIPVCYGGEFGPDLAEVAARAGLDVAAVIGLHSGSQYRVAMLGFAPGFPYLLGLPPALHAPRRADPRTRVPAGSVAIGGAQTGIYPHELPGGWQLIGRTPLSLFDLRCDPPTLLKPGDRVRFRRIDAAAFDALSCAEAPLLKDPSVG